MVGRVVSAARGLKKLSNPRCMQRYFELEGLFRAPARTKKKKSEFMSMGGALAALHGLGGLRKVGWVGATDT